MWQDVSGCQYVRMCQDVSMSGWVRICRVYCTCTVRIHMITQCGCTDQIMWLHTQGSDNHNTVPVCNSKNITYVRIYLCVMMCRDVQDDDHIIGETIPVCQDVSEWMRIQVCQDVSGTCMSACFVRMCQDKSGCVKINQDVSR